MKKTKWLSRTLIKSHVHYCIITSEKEYIRECKRLAIPPSLYGDWLIEGACATVNKFETKDGLHVALVCVQLDDKTTELEYNATLVHEAVHVYQYICEVISERYPSKEFEAYSIQNISFALMQEFQIRLATYLAEQIIKERIMQNKVLVYAGKAVQADVWAWNNKIHKHQIRYVHNLDALRGLPRGTNVHLAGTYEHRDDYIEFQHMATIRGYNLILEEVNKDESNYTPSRPIRDLSRYVHEESDTLRSSGL